jgi:hypothetical protein
MFTVIPSSVGVRLTALAWRFHAGGPAMVCRAMCAALVTSDPMTAFEDIARDALPVPGRLTCAPDRKPRRPALRLVK